MNNEVQNVTLRVLRYKPGLIDPPRFQNYTVRIEADSNFTILDCLDEIRVNQDPTLLYRHSCHHSACGTCACQINDKPRLACTTKLYQLPMDKDITIEPLSGFECLADLVVDMKGFFENIAPEWSCLKAAASETSPLLPKEIKAWQRLEDCIECGCCVSACPEMQPRERFMGPAALTAIHNQIQKNRQEMEKLLILAGGNQGVEKCNRVLACSRVCPTRVYPSRHIEDLRRKIQNQLFDKEIKP